MNTNVSHNALWNISGEQYQARPWRHSLGAVEPTPTRTAPTCTATSTWTPCSWAPTPSTTTCLRIHLASTQTALTDNDPDGTVANIGKYYLTTNPGHHHRPITVTFTVDGSVLLEDTEDHSGTEIAFTASSARVRRALRRFQTRWATTAWMWLPAI